MAVRVGGGCAGVIVVGGGCGGGVGGVVFHCFGFIYLLVLGFGVVVGNVQLGGVG